LRFNTFHCEELSQAIERRFNGLIAT